MIPMDFSLADHPRSSKTRRGADEDGSIFLGTPPSYTVVDMDPCDGYDLPTSMKLANM